MDTLNKVCWAMWIGGMFLIVGSWAGVVTPTLGWVGFGVALLGTLLSFGAQRRPQPPPEPQGRGPDDQAGKG
jgi:hypothetical protein